MRICSNYDNISLLWSLICRPFDCAFNMAPLQGFELVRNAITQLLRWLTMY